MIIIRTNLNEPLTQCFTPLFRIINPLVLKKNIFDEVFPYMGITALWSCDQNHVIIFSFSHLMNVPYGIPLQLVSVKHVDIFM